LSGHCCVPGSTCPSQQESVDEVAGAGGPLQGRAARWFGAQRERGQHVVPMLSARICGMPRERCATAGERALQEEHELGEVGSGLV
jgi:hypothetical protein